VLALGAAQLLLARTTLSVWLLSPLMIGGAVVPLLNPKQMAGDYVGLNYFQSIDTPEDQSFVRRFRQRFGAGRVIGDPMECAYVSVHLWGQAVRAADALDTAKPAPVEDRPDRPDPSGWTAPHRLDLGGADPPGAVRRLPDPAAVGRHARRALRGLEGELGEAVTAVGAGL
jgi:hypothetical protein